VCGDVEQRLRLLLNCLNVPVCGMGLGSRGNGLLALDHRVLTSRHRLCLRGMGRLMELLFVLSSNCGGGY
jgi:hypothetical protein